MPRPESAGNPDAAEAEPNAGSGNNADTDQLERGRQAYAGRAWIDAHELLSAADQGAQLGAGDLELLATSAYMLGLNDGYLRGRPLRRADRLP